MKNKLLLAMGKLKNNPAFWAWVGVVGLYLITRLYNLLHIPIFNDEAIYLHWAELIMDDWHNAFVSLTDGKQVSFIWAEFITLHIFSDPLFAGRIISVVTGLISLIGIYFLTKELFNSRKTAFIAALIYVVYPYTLMYDRMALYDSMLAMFAVWALYLEVLLVRRRQLGLALLTAVAIGGGLLTKSGALFFVVLLPFSLLLFDFGKKNKTRKKDLLKWLGLAAIATAGAFAIQSIMRLSGNFYIIDVKNSEFTITISQWLLNPVKYFADSGYELMGFVIGYSTTAFLLLAATAFFIDKKHFKEKLLLLAWLVLPFIAFACLAKLKYPRYILFMMLPLIPLAAYAANGILAKIKIKALGLFIVLLLFVPIVVKDYLIITDFANAPVPYKDKDAYIESHYSGVGVNEAVAKIKELSRDQKIYVGVHGGFGIMPYSLQSYLRGNENVEIQEFAGIGVDMPSQLTDALAKKPVYFIFRAPECATCPQKGLPPPEWPTEQILQVKRIEPNSYFTLVRIMPQQ